MENNSFSDEQGPTPGERRVLGSLAKAWNEFMDLPGMYVDHDALNDFRQAIHNAQRIIAQRIVRRTDPELWR